jgi:hypothetical protein
MCYISSIWVACPTNDARGTREIKFRIAMAKVVFDQQTALFTNKLGSKKIKK